MAKFSKNTILLNQEFFENTKIQELINNELGYKALFMFMRLCVLDCNTINVIECMKIFKNDDYEEIKTLLLILNEYNLLRSDDSINFKLVLDDLKFNNPRDKDNYIKARKEIIDYLNQRAGTNYRANAEKAKKHINARLNEKYTVDDFKKVIDKKCNEWIGTEYEKFLRPETLFGSKFEGYLNQNIRTKSVKYGYNPFLNDLIG